jgi:hypothetical protein
LSAHFGAGYLTEMNSLHRISDQIRSSYSVENLLNTKMAYTKNGQGKWVSSGSESFGLNGTVGYGPGIGLSYGSSVVGSSRYRTSSFSLGLTGGLSGSVNSQDSRILAHLSPFAFYNALKSWYYGK